MNHLFEPGEFGNDVFGIVICKRYTFRNIYSIKSSRHSFCSLLLRNNLPLSFIDLPCFIRNGICNAQLIRVMSTHSKS